MSIRSSVSQFVNLVEQEQLTDEDKLSFDEIADMYDTNTDVLDFLDSLMKLNKVMQSYFSDEELNSYAGRFDHYESDVDGNVILFESPQIQIGIKGKTFLVSLTGMLKLDKKTKLLQKKRFIFEVSQKKKDDVFFPIYKQESSEPTEIEAKIERLQQKLTL